MRLNLGCGDNVVEGWINVDYAVGARFSKIPLFSSLNRVIRFFEIDWDKTIYVHNLRRRFPFYQYPHKCMYDKYSLLRICNQIGFSAKKRLAFDSRISNIGMIENKHRVENSVIVEAQKD